MSAIKIKICGITRAPDITLAAHEGVDYLGFVFAPSPRQLNLESANRLLELVPAGIQKVGLFMDQPQADIEHIVRNSYLDLLQFHGRETNRFCGQFGLPFIKAVAMGNNTFATDFALEYPDATGILYDGHKPGEAGGSGQVFDWRRLDSTGLPLWLAGGLSAENVGEAIAAVRPWAVDVSSGVEMAPGIKDSDKLKAFVAAVKSAERIMKREQKP